MKHNFSSSLISSILLCVAAPTLVAQGGTAEPLSCADHSITARAVRSPEGVEAFVQCAYEFVQEMGFEEARRAFNEEALWRSGQEMVFEEARRAFNAEARWRSGQEMVFEEARRAFNAEARWRSGQIYVFVAEATPMSDMSRAFVFPPDPSREGEP